MKAIIKKNKLKLFFLCYGEIPNTIKECFIYKLKKGDLKVNIYVGNLTREVAEGDLQQLFAEFGEVASAAVIKDKFSGGSRGFGFVEMPDNSQAQKAIEELNGKELKGRTIVVNEARPREERRGGGGGRDRRPGGGGGGRDHRGGGGGGGRRW